MLFRRVFCTYSVWIGLGGSASHMLSLGVRMSDLNPTRCSISTMIPNESRS